ncbi:MAG: hypothetical protein WC192_05005 [Candidatus Babeliales bacterium]|jgi:hypothetical protein
MNCKFTRNIFLFIFILLNTSLNIFPAASYIPDANLGIANYNDLFDAASQSGSFLRRNHEKINRFFIQPILRNPYFVGDLSNRFAPNVMPAGAQVMDIFHSGRLGFYREFARYWNDGHFDRMLKFFAARENANRNTHFVFYHGQNNVITAYQDLMKILLRIDDDRLRVFRLPIKELDCLNIMSVYQNINERNTADGQFKHLFLSASENLFAGMFGYYNRICLNSNSECALSYFFRASADGGATILGNSSDVMSDIFNFFKIADDLRVRLMWEFNQIVRDYNLDQSQSLLQVFIPKDIVNDLVFLARPTGCMIRFRINSSVRDFLEGHNVGLLDYWQFDIVSKNINSLTKSPYIQNECRISLENAAQVRIYLKNEYFLARHAGTPSVMVHNFNRDIAWTPERNAEYLGRIARLAANFNI